MKTSLFSFLLFFLCLGLISIQAQEQDFNFKINPFGETINELDSILPLQKKLEPVRWSLKWSSDSAKKGQPLYCAIVFDIDEHWHIQSDKNQIIPDPFQPIATAVTIKSLSEGFIAEIPLYPKAEKIHSEITQSKQLAVFGGHSAIVIPLRVPEATNLETLSIEVEVHWQACDETNCLQDIKTLLKGEIPLTDGDIKPINGQYFEGLEERQEQQRWTFNFFGLDFGLQQNDKSFIPLLLLISFLSGLLMNLMPCVLPVLPLKILALTGAAPSRSKAALLGFATLLGVVLFWGGIGLAISSLGWMTSTNELFQNPTFVFSIGIVICLLAIGQAGWFEIQLPSSLMQIQPKHDNFLGALGFGLMTAILATPCAGFFMGSAVTIATALSSTLALSIFFAIGLGMGIPYFLLTLFPGILKKIPKTGHGNVVMKHSMAMLLFAAGCFFLGSGLSVWFTTPPDPPGKWHWWLVGFCISVTGFYLWSQTGKLKIKFISIAFGFLLVVSGGLLGHSMTAAGPIDWTIYTPERFEQEMKSDRALLLDFTAEWCVNCKVLEHQVLHHPKVVQFLEEKEIGTMKVDLTSGDEASRARLEKNGRKTIPWLVIYDRQGKNVFESDAYTVDQVLEALEKAQRSP